MMRAVATLLTIDEARALVLAAVSPLEAEELAVADALGRVLAEDVVAAHDVPSFANSAMDGFAIRAGAAGRRLRIVGESRAGSPAPVGVADGQAVRISTGAALPDGADAILPAEAADDHGDTVSPTEDVAAGNHVRGPGEDLRAGATVLRAGATLGPAELGLAVEAGRATVRCTRLPRVAVLATGDELVAPGEPLSPGQLHNSNAVTLGALARLAGATLVHTDAVPDDAAATRSAIGRALDGTDVLLLTGGVSVGPHDHVKPALVDLGVDEVFWRVALRPGKPLWFGTRGRRLVFGLPGNPVSSFVGFELFVRPALRKVMGHAIPGPVLVPVPLAGPYAANHDRPTYAPARVELMEELRVRPGEWFGSADLRGLLAADALVSLPAGAGAWNAGEPLPTLFLNS
jgi:molybdopterin molybdotransferase